jgi:hypothetical protein
MGELALGRDAQRELNRMWAEVMLETEGSAPQQLWSCRDGWIVGYTTGRVQGGPPEIRDRFATMAYKPIGKGARSGNPSEHVRVYIRGFATRKAAKRRAEQLYEKHSK